MCVQTYFLQNLVHFVWVGGIPHGQRQSLFAGLLDRVAFQYLVAAFVCAHALPTTETTVVVLDSDCDERGQSS